VGAHVSGPPPDALLKALYAKLLRVPAKVSSRGAARITSLWQSAYAAGRSPDGQRWPKLAASTVARKGHARILDETGATKRAARAKPAAGAGIRLDTGPKAAWHMTSYGGRPARRVLPLRLPAEWRRALEEIADDEHRRALR
jgi:hypothetical protein